MKGFVTKVVPRMTCTRVLSAARLDVAPRCMHYNTVSRPRTVSSSSKFTTQKMITMEPKTPVSLPREITWLAGAPGAGKGTNSSHLAAARGYKARTIVMSSLLESPACKRIKDAGGMVSDEIVQNALLAELTKPEYKDGVVVDGFPRTEKQAAWLSSLHESYSNGSPSSPIFNFVMLFVEEETSIARQLSRGDAIRKLNVVRKTNGLAPLEERATDTSDAAARLRYSNFVQQYEAINKLSSRFPLTVVDASAPIDVVRQRLASLKPTKASSPSPIIAAMNAPANTATLFAHM